MDSGVSKNFARRQSVARNADKFVDALRENSGTGPVSVRLVNGSLVETPRVLMDLAVKFEGLDSTEQFIVLEMDKALVSHVPTSVKREGIRQYRQGGSAPEAFMGVAEVFGVPQEVTVDSVKESAEAPPGVKPSEPREASRSGWASCPACGATKSVDRDTVPRGVRKALIAWKAEDTASNVGNLVPREPVMAKQEGKVGEDTSCVGNIVPHKDSMTDDAREEASSDVGNIVPRRGRRYRSPCQGRRRPLPEVAELLNLEEVSLDDFVADLKAGEIAEMVLLRPEPTPEELNPSPVMDEDVLEEFRKKRASGLGSKILKNPKDPVCPLMKVVEDVVSKDPPSQLPPDRGIRHEVDLVPGTKYCVTRQWPLPREQCEVIDAFFGAKAKAGMVRESKSSHSSATFCVRKPNGKWRLVHAHNKLNSATVPAQTPIPRQDVLLNNMAGCKLYSALDLVAGYYQILMRESDIPLTAVSTPSGMIWAPLRAFGQTYFDDIFVHSRAENGQTAMEVHLGHLRRVFEVMRASKLYANIDTCVFGAEEIKVIGCFVSSAGVRADPEKVKVIAAWPTPRSQKDLRKGLGLANYLHKYSAGYAGLTKPLSDLLKKDTDWRWERQHQEAFDSINASIQRAPALPDESKPFSVVCDASDYAIGCALLQSDDDGHERVISFQSR
ncbi:unnamed protein product [Phytophthora fragariaefolia]|uniref:Unnamed protein product n=1 Tax=Phytophthora fragariaefolia TaxID=1490495 RepID=A0A9W6XUM2_9STRA|nr:unnamed protein product [Phytophthora fragariaefolia]